MTNAEMSGYFEGGARMSDDALILLIFCVFPLLVCCLALSVEIRKGM